jgi:copper chaperone CopZ
MNIKLKVSGMSCEHCVAAVTKACASISGASKISVSLKDGTASFDYSGGEDAAAVIAKAKAAIEEQGFDAA